MKKPNKGFTLIELMIVIAIIGILAAIALPAYQDYVIRTRVTEGISLSGDLKARITTDVGTLSDLNGTATSWNAQAAGTGANSKFIRSILMTAATGEITITYDASSVGIAATQNTLVMTPWVRTSATGVDLTTALSTGQTGAIDWGCQSSTNTTSTANLISGTNGTLLPKFAPSLCR